MLFDTLRLVEAHEFTTQQGALHFSAALQVCGWPTAVWVEQVK